MGLAGLGSTLSTSRALPLKNNPSPHPDHRQVWGSGGAHAPGVPQALGGGIAAGALSRHRGSSWPPPGKKPSPHTTAEKPSQKNSPPAPAACSSPVLLAPQDREPRGESKWMPEPQQPLQCQESGSWDWDRAGDWAAPPPPPRDKLGAGEGWGNGGRCFNFQSPGEGNSPLRAPHKR